MIGVCLVAAFAGWLGACSTLPRGFVCEGSTALAAPEHTPLWQALVAPDEAARDRSGFTLLETGPDAYLARLALIEAATRTIDAQYYIWYLDESGQAITEALIRAADRGVRVRLLIDSLYADENHVPIGRLTGHPNIEVRLHNAFSTSFQPNLIRGVELLLNVSRLNRRMHNKILAADNTIAILGGRNISNNYFGVDPDAHFRDRDVVTVGPITAQLSESFDTFWNNPRSVPSATFPPCRTDGAFDFEAVREGMPEVDMMALPLPVKLARDELGHELAALREQLVWARGSVSWNPPGPIDYGEDVSPSEHVEAMFLDRLDAVTQEAVVQTAYMGMTDPRLRMFQQVLDRGARITVHTNSLASTNWPLAQHAYARIRWSLLHRGVSLYEAKPAPAIRNAIAAPNVTPRKTIMHAKSAVFDRRYVFVGSFNLDRRSILYNSEIGVLIDSPDLAERLLATIDRDIRPENSWRVALDAQRHVVWLDETPDPAIIHTEQPEAGFIAQFWVWIGYFLPVDDLL